MIKIIKQGGIPTCYRIACNKCGCIFTFEDEDLLPREINNFFVDRIICPCCNEELWLKTLDNYYYRGDDNG